MHIKWLLVVATLSLLSASAVSQTIIPNEGGETTCVIRPKDRACPSGDTEPARKRGRSRVWYGEHC